MTIAEKIKSAKADTMVRVNNVIYAKIADDENSRWRSAFGVVYANAFINKCRQAATVDFLNYEEPEQPMNRRKRRMLGEMENVGGEEAD